MIISLDVYGVPSRSTCLIDVSEDYECFMRLSSAKFLDPSASILARPWIETIYQVQPPRLVLKVGLYPSLEQDTLIE